MNADRAAQRIVSGTLAGKSHIILTPFAKAGLLVHGLSPQVMVKTMGVVARLLPVASPESDASDPQEGRALGGVKKSLPVKILTALGDKASKKNREHPNH